MRTTLAPEEVSAAEKLRPETNDRSGIGVHYVDAFLRPLQKGITLPDGSKFTAKRRGLKITFALGPHKGAGLMRRVPSRGEPVAMLRAALDEAGAALGVRLIAENGTLLLES